MTRRALFVHSPLGAEGSGRAAFIGKPAVVEASSGRVGVWTMGITLVGAGTAARSPTDFARAKFVTAFDNTRAAFVFSESED